MLIWFDLWNENEGSGGKKRVSMRASFNRKIRFSIIQRGASFSSPKGAARPIFEEKSAEEWFPLLFLFLLLSLSPLDLRLEIFTSIASYSFPHFFRFRIKKSCRNIWTIERETKDSKRCSLKSFFKDNEKTKDLFPRIIRKISEKKKILNAKNFNGNLGVSSSFVSIFHRKVDERRA